MENFSSNINVNQIGDIVSLKPIIFVLGPSGVGKTYVSDGIANCYSFYHFNIHSKKSGFKANGFPAEWDEDIQKSDFGNLATAVRSYPAVEQHAGAVISFETDHIFSPQQLEAASRVGISTVVLWGTEERCQETRRVRQMNRNKGELNLKRYQRKNRPAFEAYARIEYADFRIETFQPDGSRWPREHILTLVMARTAG